jgi:CubicO group peptidase (beta-lactamase class C family)
MTDLELPPALLKLLAEVELEIEKQLQETGILGVSIAIVGKDGPIWLKGFGYTDQSKKHEVNPETLFMIGSLSKIYTVTLFLRLMQKGIVHLDDKLIKHYPEFTWKTRFSEDERAKITFRHILTHYAGFQHNGKLYKEDSTANSFEDYISNISETWQKYPVGTRFSYSNIGYDLVAYVLEKITGRNFEELMREEVYSPLGMDYSSTNASAVLGLDNTAVGYKGDESIPIEYTCIPELGAGAQMSCVRDMSQFLRMHFNHGHVDDEVFLNEDLLNEIYTIPFPKPYQLMATGMGTGVFRFHYGGELALGFFGDGPGYVALQLFFPELGIGWVLQCNEMTKAYGLLPSIIQKFRTQLIEWKMGEVPPNLTVIESIRLPPETEIDESVLFRLSGRYISRMTDIDISLKDGKLTFTYQGNEIELVSHSMTKFSSHEIPLVEFSLDEGDRPLTIKLVEPDGDISILDYDSGPADEKGPDRQEWRPYLRLYSYDGREFRFYCQPVIRNGHLFLISTMNSKEYRLYEYEDGLFFTADGGAVVFREDSIVIFGIEWKPDDTSVDQLKNLVDSNPKDIRIAMQSLNEMSEIMRRTGRIEESLAVDELKSRIFTNE